MEMETEGVVALFLTEDGSDDEGLLLAMAAIDSNIYDEYQIISTTHAIDYRSKSVIGVDYMNISSTGGNLILFGGRSVHTQERRILIGIVPIGRFCSEHFHRIRQIGKC